MPPTLRRRESNERYRASDKYRAHRRKMYRAKKVADEAFRAKENERQRRWSEKKRGQTVEAVRLFCGEEVAEAMVATKMSTKKMEETLAPVVAAFWEEIGPLVETVEREWEWEDESHFFS